MSSQSAKSGYLQRADGLWLFSGSRDGTVKVWDVGRLMTPVTSP